MILFVLVFMQTWCSQDKMMCCFGWSRWSRGHRVLFLDWSIPLKRVVMKVMLASHGGDCVRRRCIGWSELGERVTLGDFLWLGPQMRRQSPVNSIAEFVARMWPYWLMANTRFCGTSRAASTFRAINGCAWRHQAGKCLTMRETSWVQRR